MTRVLFGSDFHLGHRKIHKYREWITRAEENEDFIRSNWTATKDDIVYLLGDMVFEESGFRILRSLPAKEKRLLMGNHDWERFKPSIVDIYSTFSRVYGLKEYKKAWLSHAPIQIDELYRKRFNIHGHDHTGRFDYHNDPRYFNVNTDILYRDYGVILMDYQDIQSIVLPKVEAYEKKLNSRFGRFRTSLSKFIAP